MFPLRLFRPNIECTLQVRAVFFHRRKCFCSAKVLAVFLAVRFHLFAGALSLLDCLLCARKNRISIITKHANEMRRPQILYTMNGGSTRIVPLPSSRCNAECKAPTIIPNEKSTNGENDANDRKQTEAVNTFEV